MTQNQLINSFAGEKGERERGAEVPDGQRPIGGGQRTTARAAAYHARAGRRYQTARNGAVVAARRTAANRVRFYQLNN